MEGYEHTESPARRRRETIHSPVLDKITHGRQNTEHRDRERPVHDDIRHVEATRSSGMDGDRGGEGGGTREGGNMVKVRKVETNERVALRARKTYIERARGVTLLEEGVRLTAGKPCLRAVGVRRSTCWRPIQQRPSTVQFGGGEDGNGFF